MGQMTYGILYGEELSEESQLGDLREEWEKENYKRCEHRGHEDTIPAYCYIGFFVAVGASGLESLPSLEACSLLKAQDKYAAAVESAKQRWMSFAFWAISKGVPCGDGQLWLIETEVA